jgi:N-methylhydantoinase A
VETDIAIGRLAFDTGGTFTDLTLDGTHVYKSSTTPDDPVRGVLNVLDVAAADLGLTRRDLLGSATQVVYGTTRSTNAVISGGTARTALLVTEGHPDILLWREGGRVGTFDFTVPYPDPYVPRHLTFEIRERSGAQGEVVTPLDEAHAATTIAGLADLDIEAVAVCFLWSIVQPSHERRVGELLSELLPGVPYTLSHQLNPTIREYRRASAAAIDASLKPLMGSFLYSLGERLRSEGFEGRVLVVTSGGGVLDSESVAAAPIHTLSSGPAVAPVAGSYFLEQDARGEDAIVTDAGGTSFDVSLIRRGRIPWTRETKIGRSFYGPMTGFPSIDVKSIGAGGGSIAWLDGGLLRVGPQSAGAVPGPACYGRGGTRATVTDACLVLGYLDADRFLDGAMQLETASAHAAVVNDVGEPLGLAPEEAAGAVVEVMTEQMVNAIEDIAINQGLDPRTAVVVSGGGSGGFFAGSIARRLACRKVLIPEPAAALTAVGALLSDLIADFVITHPASTARLRRDEVNEVLQRLERSCSAFIAGPGSGSKSADVVLTAEARYPQQIWDLEVPLPKPRFESAEDVEALREAFHRVHDETLGISDPASPVEITSWRAKVRCQGDGAPSDVKGSRANGKAAPTERQVYFMDSGWVESSVCDLHAMSAAGQVHGPAIVNSPATTIVVPPGMVATRGSSGTIELVTA